MGADERRELLLRYGNDIILLFDEAFRLVDCNDRALEAYGYSREELLTKSIGDLRVPQAHIDLDGRMAEFREAGSAVFESVNRRKDGSTFPVETSVRTVQTPSELFYPTTVRDITKRRLAELDLMSAGGGAARRPHIPGRERRHARPGKAASRTSIT